MNRMPPALNFQQRALAFAASVVLTAAICSANLGIAQGYASQPSVPLAAARAPAALSTACTQGAARS